MYIFISVLIYQTSYPIISFIRHYLLIIVSIIRVFDTCFLMFLLIINFIAVFSCISYFNLVMIKPYGPRLIMRILCSSLLAILFIILYLLNIDSFFHSFFFKKLYLNLIYLKGSFLCRKFLHLKDSYWFKVQETFLYFPKLWIKREKNFSICLFYYNLQIIFFQ